MSVEEVLRRKIQLYKANGNHAAAQNAEEVLRVGVNALKASIPTHKAVPEGSGKRKRLREPVLPVERTLSDNVEFGSGKSTDILRKMMTDPTYAADVMHKLRRPRGVSKVRHGISGRAAIKEPMLTAKASSIADGLAYKEPAHKDRLVKGPVYAQLVVKPLSSKNARLEHSSAFWAERLWYVFTLRYASGYVLVTDKGSESRVFPTYGEMRSAITKSGWEIIK